MAIFKLLKVLLLVAGGLAALNLIPVEVYELIRQMTTLRVAVLLGNVLVVAYLAGALRRGRGRSH